MKQHQFGHPTNLPELRNGRITTSKSFSWMSEFPLVKLVSCCQGSWNFNQNVWNHSIFHSVNKLFCDFHVLGLELGYRYFISQNEKVVSICEWFSWKNILPNSFVIIKTVMVSEYRIMTILLTDRWEEYTFKYFRLVIWLSHFQLKAVAWIVSWIETKASDNVSLVTIQTVTSVISENLPRGSYKCVHEPCT